MSEKYELSRRKALAALGTIGVAGAGAGMGTSALFTDEEDFNNNTLTAGELNLLVDYWTSQNTNTSTTDSGTQDGGVSALLELTDVKPGDRLEKGPLAIKHRENADGYIQQGGQQTGDPFECRLNLRVRQAQLIHRRLAHGFVVWKCSLLHTRPPGALMSRYGASMTLVFGQKTSTAKG